MSDEVIEAAAQRVADRARLELESRLRAALEHQARAAIPPMELSEHQLAQLVQSSARRAGPALWRRCLITAASVELGTDDSEAQQHPALRRAAEIVGAPGFDDQPASPSGAAIDAEPVEPLRVAAVHRGGIESLREGEDDIELRFSAEGVDVLVRSSGATIGRLAWVEIEKVDLPRHRRGLRRGRRGQELHVVTRQGRASFSLPDIDDDQLTEHLEPFIAARAPSLDGFGA